MMMRNLINRDALKAWVLLVLAFILPVSASAMCSGRGDIWFANDESGSVNDSELAQALDFIYQVSDEFVFNNTTGAKAGIIGWASDSSPEHIIIPISDIFSDPDDTGLLDPARDGIGAGNNGDNSIVVDSDTNGVRELYTARVDTSNGTRLDIATAYIASLINDNSDATPGDGVTDNGRRDDVAQIAVILTDASSSQLTSNGSGGGTAWSASLNTLRAAGENGTQIVIMLIDDAANSYNANTSGTRDLIDGYEALGDKIFVGDTYSDIANPAQSFIGDLVDDICELTKPSVDIENAPASISNNNTFTLTFQFNVDVSNFVATDITLANATPNLASFTQVDANTYTMEITPDGSANNITIDVPVDVAQDSVGANNRAATQVIVIYDTDGDGIPDSEEGASTDSDGDSVFNNVDIDSDNDGIPDEDEVGPDPLNPVDTDGDSIPDYLDLDSDNDGFPDLLESGLSEGDINALDLDNDGQIDAANTFGMDGLANDVQGGVEGNPIDYTIVDTDSDGINDFRDLDKDNDAIPDLYESGLSQSDINTLDADGDGQIDLANAVGTDGIANAVQNNTDGAGLDYDIADTDLDGVIDALDLDADNDGIPDLIESGLLYTDINTLDANNDGRIDSSINVGADGIANAAQSDIDGAPLDFALLNSDTDSVFDYRDLDSDNDGLTDIREAGLVDANADGLVDGNDGNSDGLADSGVVTQTSSMPDADGDDTPDNREIDSDNDMVFDNEEPGVSSFIKGLDANDDGIIDDTTDTDGDGIPNSADPAVNTFGTGGDSDGDGIPDAIEGVSQDTDGDGINNHLDIDSDNDGIPDADEVGASPVSPVDTDGDGIADIYDLDTDNDGIADIVESGLTLTEIANLDADGDGQIDSGNAFGVNGLADSVEVSVDSGTVDYNNDNIADSQVDSDGDLVPDFRDLDKDNDGITDLVESGLSPTEVASLDTDADGRIDPPSQTAGNVVGLDGIVDSIQGDTDGNPLDFEAADTDSDGVADALDLDADNDGIPDLLESGLSKIEIASLDTNNDGQIDPPSQTPGNIVGDDGIVDSIQGGVDGDGLDFIGLDSNADGVPDGTDTDKDGIRDSNDLDSDNDGLLDISEAGTTDENSDGLVDGDVDANGVDLASIKNVNNIPDADGDDIPDYRELDSNNDGTFDIAESGVDPDIAALDMNNDGLIDGSNDPTNDPDKDGIYGDADPSPNRFGAILDSDGDGINDADEIGDDPSNPRDTDGDGIPDFRDADSDNDGLPDILESNADCLNLDGTDAPDDGDCNNDGVLDHLDDEGLITAVEGVGSTNWYFLLMSLILLVIRQKPSSKAMQKIIKAIPVLGLSLALSITPALLGKNNVSAHDHYSARYVMPDDLLEWVKYNEDVHGEMDKVEEQLNFHPGYYAGIGLGLTHVDPERDSNGFMTDDNSDSGFKLYFGRHFKPKWAWEVSYAELGEAGLDNPTNATLNALVPNAAIDYSIPAGWIKYLPMNPNSDFSVDIKAGLAAITNSANDSRIGFEKQTSVQLAFGLGAQWRFTERFFARLDFDSYDSDANYTGISLGMYFGDHDEHKKAQPILDSDKDGVLDPDDQCPTTPFGTEVDVVGCALPLDSDNDGVFDDEDQCPNSALNADVNELGCVPPAPTPEPVKACEPFPGVVEGVNFKTNSSELTNGAKQVLADVAPIFKSNIGSRIEVQAHTDSRGSAVYNLNLSDRRAASVKAYLIELGVEPAALQSQGYGESQPRESNDTEEGRAKNRRVELKPLDEVCK